jgi:hypothetical protein
MSDLVSIGGGHQLSPEAAASWRRMAALSKDVDTRYINSSTRDYATQLDWFRNKGKPGYPKYVADPDTSKHVWRPNDTKDKGARALDVNAPLRTWLVSNGADHGWYRPWPDIEPWHFEYRIQFDKFKDDDMPLSKDDLKEIRSVVKELIPEIAEGVLKYQNTLSPNAATLTGNKTLSTWGAIQQNIYTRSTANDIKARVSAIEKAINKGTTVSAKDVAAELRPLLSADLRAAVQNLPSQDADKIADAVIRALVEGLSD